MNQLEVDTIDVKLPAMILRTIKNNYRVGLGNVSLRQLLRDDVYYPMLRLRTRAFLTFTLPSLGLIR